LLALTTSYLPDRIELFVYDASLVQWFQNRESILVMHDVLFDIFNHVHKLFSFMDNLSELVLSINSIHKSIHIVFLGESEMVSINQPIQTLIQMASYLDRNLLKLFDILQIRNFDTKVYYLMVWLKIWELI